MEQGLALELGRLKLDRLLFLGVRQITLNIFT